MQSKLPEPLPEPVQRMDAAFVGGLIADDQDRRVEATDVILRAERTDGQGRLWVAIEASSSIHEGENISVPGSALTFSPSCSRNRLRRRSPGTASATWTPNAPAISVPTRGSYRLFCDTGPTRLTGA